MSLGIPALKDIRNTRDIKLVIRDGEILVNKINT